MMTSVVLPAVAEVAVVVVVVGVAVHALLGRVDTQAVHLLL
jgi:hypothetical protein